MTVRLATWNVLHARSPTDGRVDLDRFAAAVAELDVDVLGLQEVDHGQPRSHGVDLTDLAARALGARYRCFVPTMVGLPGEWSPVGDPGRADPGWVADPADLWSPTDTPRGHDTTPIYGVALVSRYPVLAWRALRLSPARVSLPMMPGRPARPVLVPDEPRVAIAARVAVPGASGATGGAGASGATGGAGASGATGAGAGGPITVVTTHLSFAPGWNLVQLRRVVDAFADEERLVVTGDLNTGGWAARTASGLPNLVTGPTFPAWSPVVQLDHVLGRGVEAAESRVAQLPVSDHRALVVTLR